MICNVNNWIEIFPYLKSWQYFMEHPCPEFIRQFLMQQSCDCMNSCTKPSSQSQQMTSRNLWVFLAGFYLCPKYLLPSFGSPIKFVKSAIK